ncbi:uncharacterized protein LOC134538502 isoform X2 [Bacillus rossius redtenbacheri]|uniref:uncharacterized protein LOC134538502 isoform X2 n=1 Tax=Bacillus rossius redtenbacheri TaxID=93214 RepID=UPI002FDED0EC
MSAVTIDDLPPELMMKIFESLRPEELLIVQDVSTKWQVFARTSSVWETFVYSPETDSSEEDLIAFVEKCPMLKHIRTKNILDKDKIIPAVIKNCYDIHSFCVEFMPSLEISQLEALFEAFPNIDTLLIRIEYHNASEIVDRLSRCTKLKKLILSGQCCRDGVFKPIVDGCPSLEYLSFNGGFPNVSKTDILYVLQNMNDRLSYLRFGFSPITQQIVNLLGTFTKLEDVLLHDATHNHIVDFKPLANIKTLKCLKFESFASEFSEMCRFLDVLFGQPFPLLEKLDICFFHCEYDKTVLQKICQCYPNLKYLRLYGKHPADIKDGFKDICKLQRLESLGFSSSDTIMDDDIESLSRCLKLKELDLRLNHLLTDKTIVHLAKCKALETLDLSYSSITGENLHMVAENLKLLKNLDVKQCKYLDEKNLLALADKMPSLKIIKDGGICFG